MSLDNQPTPDPVPQPPDDDNDDQRMYWPDPVNGTQLTIYALGTTTPKAQGTGTCCAGLFASKEGFTAAFEGTTTVLASAGAGTGSAPAAVGRQLGRWYASTKGGGDFEVWMAAPEQEIIGGGKKSLPTTDQYQQLYFAWLTGDQYKALLDETSHQAGSSPRYDSNQANHDALTFASTPAYKIGQPKAEVWGSLTADPNLSWRDVRVTLFGSCGPGKSGGTRRTWAYSAEAIQQGGTSTWQYGASLGSPPVKSWDRPFGGDSVHEVWVAAWGWYTVGGKHFAAVAPPLLVNKVCRKTNLGITGPNSRPLPNATMGPDYFDSFRSYVRSYESVRPILRVPPDGDGLQQDDVSQKL